MSEAMVEHFKQVTSSTLLTAGCDKSTVTTVRTMLNEHLVNFKEPLHFLSSTYKQDTYFDNHPLAVKPETVDFCPRYETSSGVSRVVYDSFQYISVESTVRSLLQSEQFVKVLHCTTFCMSAFDVTDAFTFLLLLFYCFYRAMLAQSAVMRQ